MDILITEAAVSVAAELGKTVTASAGHSFVVAPGATLAFSSGTAYVGHLRYSKSNLGKSATVTTKFGLTTGAGQVARKVATAESNNGEVNGATFTSLVSKNCYVEFIGYKFTYTP